MWRGKKGNKSYLSLLQHRHSVKETQQTLDHKPLHLFKNEDMIKTRQTKLHKQERFLFFFHLFLILIYHYL